MNKKTTIILSLLTIFGALLRFWNLNWGAPFYFHPDERNIANAVTQLNFPHQMNPHFFAYGSFPIYIIYFTAVFLNFFSHFFHSSQSVFTVLFEQAIIISRIYSALLSTAIIFSLYIVGKKLGNKRIGIIAAFFGTTSVGFLQFAHFGTFEMWLTFLGLWFFYSCLLLLQTVNKKTLILVGILLGLLLSVKVVTLVFLPFPFIVLRIHYYKERKKLLINLYKSIIGTLKIYAISFITVLICCPFIFLNKVDFLNSMHYESSVGLGTEKVFYSQEFINKIPILFQFLHVFPFLINPFVLLIFLISFGYVLFFGIKQKNTQHLFLLVFFLIILFSQGFLFVKWTRYMMPTLPFIYLIVAIFLERLMTIKKSVLFTKTVIFLLCIICSIFAVSYIITTFSTDTRIAAEQFAKQNISNNATIVSEVYDLGIVPFNADFNRISLYNFYDMDNSSTFNRQDFLQYIKTADYIILPSQRIAKTRLLDKKDFPNGNWFYTKLFNGTLGFKKIYQTPCDIFCQITHLGNPNNFEETATVFDRPTVYIFKRKN